MSRFAFLQIPIALLHSPLIRNGYSLVASTALTSVLGLIFWILAARLFSAEEVGVGAALISILLTIGNIAQLNLGNILNRFLPDAGSRAVRLIAYSYGAGILAALVISVVALAFIDSSVTSLATLLDDPWSALGFIVAVVCWTLFALQDSALSGLRQSSLVPVENSLYAIAKIVLLLLFAWTAHSTMVVFVAWTLPLPIIILAINLIIAYRLLNNKDRQAPGVAHSRQDILRFFGWDYVGTLALMSAMGLASILVLKIAGPAAMAEYHLAFTIAYTLYLISRSMGISLLAESVTDRVRMSTYVADAIVYTMLPLVSGAVLIFTLAPWIMGLFGPAYTANGTGLLRLLALSCLPWGFTTVYLAVARAQGRLAVVAIVQVSVLILVVGLAAPLLGSMGSLGMGIAWLAAHTVSACGILIFVTASEGRDALLENLLRIATAFAKLRSTIRQGYRPHPVANPAVDDIARKTGIAEAARWQPLRQAVSQSDVLTTFLGDPSLSAPQAVLKTPLTQRGTASLEQYLSRLERLHADHRLSGIGIRFPEILLVERQSALTHLYERMMPGEDGRITVQKPGCRGQALRAAVSAMASIHDATCTTVTIGDCWIKKWIDEPAGNLLRTLPALMTANRRSAAVACFRAEQYQFWSGYKAKLGLGHGDFCPGNILYSLVGEQATEWDAASPEIKVEAFIDWDRSLSDAPAGLDASHLALTARALVRGDEMGHVVRRVLIEKEWSTEERHWLNAPAHGATESVDWITLPQAVRAMAGLAWLHHVTANLEKSSGYAENRLWIAANVERVLQAYLKFPYSGEPS